MKIDPRNRAMIDALRELLGLEPLYVLPKRRLSSRPDAPGCDGRVGLDGRTPKRGAPW